MTYSIRKRLIGYLLVPLTALLAFSIVTDYREGLHVANKAYDHALFGTALAIAAQLDPDESGLDLDLQEQAEQVLRADMADEVFYAVIDRHGRLIAGDPLLQTKLIPARGENPAYRFDRIGSKEIRLVTYHYQPTSNAREDAFILVAETTKKRQRAASRIMVTTLWTDLLLILTSLAVVFFGVRYALVPLERMSRRIECRQPDDLRPLDEAQAPKEIRPFVRAINGLVANLREAASAQQAFLSNAAHQLRTPLAALQTQLELVAETLQGEPRERLRRAQESLTRLSHLTRQMLALARAAHQANTEADFTPVSLEDLVEAAASDFLDTAIARDIHLEFEAAPAVVAAQAWTLRELLANLLDNALRYTPAGGWVTVRCGVANSGIPFLEVEDDGPGIPPHERDKVFERFVRLETDSAGSGLGLAIVKEVADLHRAHITLTEGSNGKGLRVRVDFPPMQAHLSRQENDS